jgi:predicted RNase H-like nuclease
VLFDLIKDGMLIIKNMNNKKVAKRINKVLDKLDDKRRKENRIPDGIDALVDLIVNQKSIDTIE